MSQSLSNSFAPACHASGLFAAFSALVLPLLLPFFDCSTGDPASTSGAALSAAAADNASGNAITNANSNSNKPAATHAIAATSRHHISSSSSGGDGQLVTSSMCPVVGLNSFWCQVGHKTLLHVIAFAGRV